MANSILQQNSAKNTSLLPTCRMCRRTGPPEFSRRGIFLPSSGRPDVGRALQVLTAEGSSLPAISPCTSVSTARALPLLLLNCTAQKLPPWMGWRRRDKVTQAPRPGELLARSVPAGSLLGLHISAVHFGFFFCHLQDAHRRAAVPPKD